jgi:hypothetical protein
VRTQITILGILLFATSSLSAWSALAHECGVTDVIRTAKGVGFEFSSPTHVFSPLGTVIVDSTGVLHRFYPAHPGDKLFSTNSPEDSCVITVGEDGLTASSSFHLPGLPGQDRTDHIMAVASTDELSKLGEICWLRGAVKVSDGIDVYFSSARNVRGPSGDLLVDSEPLEVRTSYSAAIGDALSFGPFCNVKVVMQGSVLGASLRVENKLFPVLNKEEFVPAK